MTSGYGVFLGLDVGKGEHHAVGLDPTGRRLHDAPLPNSEPKLRALFDKLTKHGPLLVVVDQPATIGALPVAVARAAGHQVAYLPGLAMRRIADLYPGRAKTDARDAFIIADPARSLPHTLRPVDVGDDALAELEVLVGFDNDLAGEATRIGNRIRGLLTGIHPALERATGPRISHPAVLEILSRSSIKGEHPARTGNRKLKRAFFLSAFAALADPTSRAYYQRKRDEGKKHNAALICLARRRCDVLFAMLRNKTNYRHPETNPAPAAA
ncbi:IS110 family transposase [Actinokineospora sp. NBRC 105648]|uniref:IS110 family transposase n=1 Tax=Actinokineospora sp. NBRC 105648 TaxID=3032206 RepID=UPI0024A556E6|nr:IS110 family transposase [Actinokineospora sp. NBRC 105648]GLZ43482.1 hypothetical protein Acsp05_71060 [Actinokineospora sp. NBRC 105648]